MFHELRLEMIVRLVNIGGIVDHHFDLRRLIDLWYLQVFPVEHILFPKNGISPIGFDPGTSRIVSRHSTNWAKADLNNCKNKITKLRTILQRESQNS